MSCSKIVIILVAIFAVLLIVFFAWLNINSHEGCTTATGENGICMLAKKCNAGNVMYYNEDFCPEDKSKICCKIESNDSSTSTPEFLDYSKWFDMKNCGKAGKEIIFCPRISNGEESAPNKYLWAVLISFKLINGKKFGCGGSLINGTKNSFI